MNFTISPDVAQLFPRIFVGGVIARHVRMAASSGAAALLEQAQEQIVRMRASGGTLHAEGEERPWEVWPQVRIWHEAFAQAGIEPRHVTSVEALIRRVATGERLPSINPVVDLANAISLKYRLPVGAHDVDTLLGSLSIRFAAEGAHFFPPTGGDEVVPAGELVYADAKEVRTRRWVWRQSAHGRVTRETETVFFPIDGFIGETEEAVRAAAEDLATLAAGLLGARTRVFFLDANHRTAPILRYGLMSRVRRGGDAIDEVLGRGVVDLITREEVEPRLRGGDTLRIKLGFDPTGPLLHIGRATRLFKLREFQRLGHTIQFVVGDFTGMLGDASDKTAKRQMLTAEQVRANMATYVQQAGKILDMSHVETRYNAEWLSRIRLADVIRMASEFTVSQMIERENFIDRYRAGKPIGLHELLYPLLQGHDSVVLRSDIELGGTDQLFNMLAGRVLQHAAGQSRQVVMTGPLILGTNGEKMSTSVGNVVNILDAPDRQYFSIMRMIDDLMVQYFETCTTVPLAEVREISEQLEDDAVNPIDVKRRLARTIVTQFHDASAAREAETAWDAQVRHGTAPTDVPVIMITADPRPLIDLLLACNVVASRSEARRAVEGRAVTIDGERAEMPHQLVAPRDGMLVRVGKKKWARVSVEGSAS